MVARGGRVATHRRRHGRGVTDYRPRRAGAIGGDVVRHPVQRQILELEGAAVAAGLTGVGPGKAALVGAGAAGGDDVDGGAAGGRATVRVGPPLSAYGPSLRAAASLALAVTGQLVSSTRLPPLSVGVTPLHEGEEMPARRERVRIVCELLMAPPSPPVTVLPTKVLLVTVRGLPDWL